MPKPPEKHRKHRTPSGPQPPPSSAQTTSSPSRTRLIVVAVVFALWILLLFWMVATRTATSKPTGAHTVSLLPWIP